MAFVKFEIIKPEKPAPLIPDVKIGPLGLSINPARWSEFSLGEPGPVNLWWDQERGLVAISPSSKDDKSTFTAKPRGKNGASIFIPWKKFVQAFAIPVDGVSTATLETVDDMTAFKLPNAAPIAAPKKRGRRAREA